MSFSMELTPAQHDLVRRTHEFAEQVIRPVADEYDRSEEFPWPVLDEAAKRGFYNALFYRDLIADPTGLSLPQASLVFAPRTVLVSLPAHTHGRKSWHRLQKLGRSRCCCRRSALSRAADCAARSNPFR